MESTNSYLGKILVVTKSVLLQQELRKALDQYLLITVENAKQAIEKLTSTKDISAVFVGIYLPETKGFELLDYFKANKDFYTGPVLIITDAVNDTVIDKVKDYDVFDYLIRYSNDYLIKTTVRNAVIYYGEKQKLLAYAVDQVYKNLNDMRMFVLLLAQLVEFKNYESGKHVDHVGQISKILAKRLLEKYPGKYNLTPKDIEYISMAAALHDIGKVYIPDYILNKPGKLDEQEKLIMRTHAELGAGIIERLSNYKDRTVFRLAHDIALYHHERFDGSGYPQKLKGNTIPIAAQIVSISDCFDALISDRVYRRALVPVSALNMIENGECGMFNPDLITCFWECYDEIIASLNKSTNVDVTKDDLLTIIKDICKVK